MTAANQIIEDFVATDLVHLIFGTVFLSVGWGWRADTATPPTR